MATYDAGDASINIRPSLKGFVTELEADLKKIDAQLGVEVHPNLAQAQADLARWRAQEERNSIDIPVNVDTNSVQRATREMGKLADAGKALSALKWNAGALGLGSWPALATSLTAVAGSIQQISQAGLLLPGVMAAGGAAVGTFKLGVAGVADAFKAVEKSADGSTKSIEAANEALAGLAPSARDAVKTAAEVKTELTKALQQPVQENLFKGVSGDLRKLVDADLPVLQKGLSGIASGLNENLRQLMATAGSESSQGILGRVLGNTGDAQSRLTKAIDPLVHGLGTLAGAGTDTFPRLADGVGRLAQRFDQFVSKADGDGRLAKWIDGGIKGVEHLGSIVLDLGKSLAAITQAAGGGEGLLAILDKGAESLATFLSSAEGQEKLTRFFTEGREQLGKWLEVLQNLMPILGGVYNAAKQWTDALLPALESITGLLAGSPNLVSNVATAFLAWKSIQGVTSLLGNIGGIGRGMDLLPGKADTAAGGISRALSRIAIPAALSTLLVGQTKDMIGPDQSTASNAGGLGLNVAGGAAIGAATAGAPGAIVGAIAGLGVSVYERVLADIKKGQKEFEDKWAADHNAGAEREGSKERQMEAVPAIKGTMLPSQFFPDGTPRPTASQGLADQIRAGTMPGYSVNPDGSVVGPGGVVVPGLKLPPPAAPKPPPPPPPKPQVPMLNGVPVPFALPPAGPALTVPAVVQPKNPVTAGPEIAAKMNPQAQKQVDQLAKSIEDLPTGEVKITDPSPAVVENLKKLDVQIEQVGKNEIKVKANTDDAKLKLDNLIREYQARIIQLRIGFPAAPGAPGPAPQPKRAGGAISGGEPGKDSVHLLGMPGEHMLTTDDVSAMGGQANVYAFRQALHNRGVRGYAGGGAVVDEFGNPINPGVAPGPGAAPSIAPNPYAGGGLAGIFGSVVSGIQGPIGNAMSLGSSLANLGGPTAGADSGIIPGLQTQHGAGTIVPAGYTPSGGAPLSLADRAAGMPGLFGLFGSLASSNPAQNLMSWGEQTGQWLGNFTARTVGSFATSLWKGALGIFGLENSILSPDNPWNLAGQSVGQFAFGSDGPLGKLLGANPGAGAAGSDSRKAMDPKKIREAQQKVADKQKAVEEQRARMADMPAKASQSTRMTRQNALDKAIREANDAQTDLTSLLSGASASGSGMSGLAYPIGGTGAEQWRPTVRQVLAAYGPAYGITGSNFQSWEDALVRQINTESGGNPNSVNANDSNGRGGTQRVAGILNFLQSTFEAHNVTGGDYMDPGSQIAAALPYVAKRWGVDENGAPLQIGRGQGFAFGGGVRGPGGPKGDQIPAMLSDNEHVLTAEDVDAMGGQSAVYAFRGALHRAPGGEVSLALLRNPTPPPRPTVPDIKPMTPRPPTPTPAPRPAPAPAAQQPAPAPAPQGPQPATQEPAQQQGGQSRIGGPGPGSAPSQLNHNLPWIDTAIDSTASTLGNIAATAMSMGAAGGTAGMGGGAGGALASSMVAGLFQQGGKIAKNVVNVFSSALVGNLGDNTTAGAYGAPLLSAPPQPARSIDARTVFGDVSANDPRDFVEKQRLYEQQRSQTMVDYV